MRKFELVITVENASFEGDNVFVEVAKILRKTAEKVESGSEEGAVMDTNGNKVGDYTIS